MKSLRLFLGSIAALGLATLSTSNLPVFGTGAYKTNQKIDFALNPTAELIVGKYEAWELDFNYSVSARQ